MTFKRGDVVSCPVALAPASKNNRGGSPQLWPGNHTVVISSQIHDMPVISFSEDGPLYNALFFHLVRPAAPECLEPWRELSWELESLLDDFEKLSRTVAKLDNYWSVTQEAADEFCVKYKRTREALGTRLRWLEEQV